MRDRISSEPNTKIMNNNSNHLFEARSDSIELAIAWFSHTHTHTHTHTCTHTQEKHPISKPESVIETKQSHPELAQTFDDNDVYISLLSSICRQPVRFFVLLGCSGLLFFDENKQLRGPAQTCIQTLATAASPTWEGTSRQQSSRSTFSSSH
jgi:hypothetical protein